MNFKKLTLISIAKIDFQTKFVTVSKVRKAEYKHTQKIRNDGKKNSTEKRTHWQKNSPKVQLSIKYRLKDNLSMDVNFIE